MCWRTAQRLVFFIVAVSAAAPAFGLSGAEHPTRNETPLGHEVRNAAYYNPRILSIALTPEQSIQERSWNNTDSSSDRANGRRHVIIERAIHFKADSVALTSSDEHRLLLLARAARSHQEYFLSVLGPVSHDPDTNHLSAQRVHATMTFLNKSGGVSSDKLLVASPVKQLRSKKDSGSEAHVGQVIVRVIINSAQMCTISSVQSVCLAP